MRSEYQRKLEAHSRRKSQRVFRPLTLESLSGGLLTTKEPVSNPSMRSSGSNMKRNEPPRYNCTTGSRVYGSGKNSYLMTNCNPLP